MATLQTDSQALQQRLEKLERGFRALQWAMAFIMLFVALVLLKASWPGRFVEAEGFILKDGKGTVRGRLGIFDEDAFLHLYNEREKLQASLDVASFGSSLSLHDSEGNIRGLFATNQDVVNLVLYSEAKKARAALTVTSGGPVLELFDTNGVDRAKFGMKVEKDKEQMNPAHQQQNYSFVIFDPKGDPLFTAP